MYDITEADEAAHGDRLVALANVRFQVISDESFGVIDDYIDAAVRLGTPRDLAWDYVGGVRKKIRGVLLEDERRQMLNDLIDSTYDYQLHRIDATTFGQAIGLPAALLS